jgi:hypothetical protein
MSQLAELHTTPSALAANIFLVPVEKHVNLVYIGLAVIFACVLAYMFLSKRQQ